MKQLIYKNESGQVETYDLTGEKAEVIVRFLESGNRATHFTLNGQSFMAKNSRVREKVIPQMNIDRGYNLNNPIEMALIEKFEIELAKDWNNNPEWKFTDYLVKLDAIRIDTETDSEIIRNPRLYMELDKKWNALNELRHKREKSKKLGIKLIKSDKTQKESLAELAETKKIECAYETETPREKDNGGVKIEDLGF